MKNQDVARLTTTFVSQEGKALESWKYSMVSTNLPSADFASAKLLLSYFTSLCEMGVHTGKALAAKGFLSTDPDKLELNFYDKNGKARKHKQIKEASIHSRCMCQAAAAIEDITLASLRERAASNSGLKACFKDADAQTSSLCIFSSQLKPMNGKVGNFTLYSPHTAQQQLAGPSHQLLDPPGQHQPEKSDLVDCGLCSAVQTCKVGTHRHESDHFPLEFQLFLTAPALPAALPPPQAPTPTWVSPTDRLSPWIVPLSITSR